MKKLILGARKGPAVTLRILSAIRMGDMAAIHVMLGEWRHRNPERRLTLIYNPFDRLHEYSRHIPIDWAYGEFADEIWVRERANENIPTIVGEDLYEFHNGKAKNYVHLWAEWKKLMTTRSFIPTIKIPQAVITKASAVLKSHRVPQKFVVLQTLFDAGYHKYRNAPPDWWVNVSKELVKKNIPTVMLGPTQYMERVKVPDGVFPVFKSAKDPFMSMAITTLSSTFVGGETGLPLWASIFKIPVVALFRGWTSCRQHSHLDYRPIDFGAPVVYSPLEADPQKTVEVISDVFNGLTKVSTPLT